MPISIPVPQLQIDFAFALEQIRGLYLQHALSDAVGKLDIKNIDAELARIVDEYIDFRNRVISLTGISSP